MSIRHSDIGEALTELTGSSTRELVLVAPFVKAHALQRLLEPVTDSVAVTLVTRWRIDEIAAGVSDVHAYDVVCSRSGRVWLVDSLHAKYFRADRRILVGSANITGAALGWSSHSNLELVARCVAGSDSESFEQSLLRNALLVDDRLAQTFSELQAELRVSESQDVAAAAVAPGDRDSVFDLLPRDPTDVWIAYRDPESDLLSIDVREKLHRLLIGLAIPSGINRRELLSVAVGSALWLVPAVQEFHQWLDGGRRFGEVAAWVRRQSELDRDDGVLRAQTLLRSLLYFIPDRFGRKRPNHTEIVFSK
jgi:hypothetical protein